MNPRDLVSRLQELIAALDRRIAPAGRPGEASIAREAAALRAHAVARLRELVPRRHPAAMAPDRERT